MTPTKLRIGSDLPTSQTKLQLELQLLLKGYDIEWTFFVKFELFYLYTFDFALKIQNRKIHWYIHIWDYFDTPILNANGTKWVGGFQQIQNGSIDSINSPSFITLDRFETKEFQFTNAIQNSVFSLLYATETNEVDLFNVQSISANIEWTAYLTFALLLAAQIMLYQFVHYVFNVKCNDMKWWQVFVYAMPCFNGQSTGVEPKWLTHHVQVYC
jgi:hypothetical protein